MKLALMLLLATVTAVMAQEKLRCYTAPNPSLGYPWAWRMVEGRTCWYRGERKRDKSLLYWPHEARAESAVPISPANVETEPPTTAPEPEPTPAPEQLQAYSPEDEKLLTSYWPDLPTLLAERSPTHEEMFAPAAPSRWRDHDAIMILILALIVVSGLVLGLEALRTKLDMQRTQ